MPHKLSFEYPKVENQRQIRIQQALADVIKTARLYKQTFKRKLESIFAQYLEKSSDYQESQKAESQYIATRRDEAGWNLDSLKREILKLSDRYGLLIISEARRIDIDDLKGNTLLRIHIDDSRFKGHGSSLVQSPIFSVHGSDKQYVLDDSGTCIPRYALRFITHEERNRIAARYGYILTGLENNPKDHVLEARHRGLAPTQHELTNYNISNTDKDLTRRQQEFLLNRAGTQRLLPITKTSHALRSNKFYPFIEFGDLFYLHKARPGSGLPDTYGLGGGMVLLDLARVPATSIRAQYTPKAVKEYQGFGRKKLDERQSTDEQHERERAMVSAIRNREIHIGPVVPDDAILAWSAGPHEKAWRPLDEVTPTLESDSSTGRTYYQDTLQPVQKLGRPIELQWSMSLGLKSKYGHPERPPMHQPIQLSADEQVFFDYLMKNEGIKFGNLGKKEFVEKALKIDYGRATTAYEGLKTKGAAVGVPSLKSFMPCRKLEMK